MVNSILLCIINSLSRGKTVLWIWLHYHILSTYKRLSSLIIKIIINIKNNKLLLPSQKIFRCLFLVIDRLSKVIFTYPIQLSHQNNKITVLHLYETILTDLLFVCVCGQSKNRGYNTINKMQIKNSLNL